LSSLMKTENVNAAYDFDLMRFDLSFKQSQHNYRLQSNLKNCRDINHDNYTKHVARFFLWYCGHKTWGKTLWKLATKYNW